MPDTKSENDGPALSLSANVVALVRGRVTGRSSVVVAKDRVDIDIDAEAEAEAEEVVVEGRKTLKGEDHELPWRQRDRGIVAAIADELLADGVEVVG